MVFEKGDELRIFTVALHPPHDVFLTRGKHFGTPKAEANYYIMDQDWFLKGAATLKDGKIEEVPRGEAWMAFEREKAFWLWQAEQIEGSSNRGR